ncbi:delta-type opioid receptor-like [Scleropages formosus]|uniref:Delta-type opioid receptor-like n=1 Tax=Scleropages formosus TaxID=113540 RepID=A0A0P7V1N0_SCLFO|nr:delta-type opioid receptor-like [Scleropages formosus]
MAVLPRALGRSGNEPKLGNKPLGKEYFPISMQGIVLHWAHDSHKPVTMTEESAFTMDPVELERLQEAVSTQEALLDAHKQCLKQILEKLRNLVQKPPVAEHAMTLEPITGNIPAAASAAPPALSAVVPLLPTTNPQLAPPKRYTKMKTATNIYIFNLALADALATSTLPFQSAKYLMNTWPFGELICKVVIAIDYYNMFTSIFTLTMMSVDRYIAVCHPVRALDFRTPIKAKIINVCVWILSSAVGVPIMIMAITKVNDKGKTVCTLKFPDPDWYWDTVTKICVFIFAFVVPVLVITICYGLMILRLKSVRLLSGSKEKDKNLRRITRMVLVVVAAFIVCWTPIHIFIIVKTLVEVDQKNPFVIASWHLCIALGYTNSSLNPVLYAFLDENFKRCFRDFCLPFRSRIEQNSFSRARNMTREPVSVCAPSEAGKKPV